MPHRPRRRHRSSRAEVWRQARESSGHRGEAREAREIGRRHTARTWRGEAESGGWRERQTARQRGHARHVGTRGEGGHGQAAAAGSWSFKRAGRLASPRMRRRGGGRWGGPRHTGRNHASGEHAWRRAGYAGEGWRRHAAGEAKARRRERGSGGGGGGSGAGLVLWEHRVGVGLALGGVRRRDGVDDGLGLFVADFCSQVRGAATKGRARDGRACVRW